MLVPPEKYPFHSRQDIQVRFNDIDILGHVNNTVFLQYMDYGKMQYITEVFGKIFNYRKESLVIVNHNCEYYQIAHYDEPLQVLTRVDKIGLSSITFEQRVINPVTDAVKCICNCVMVGYNVEKNEKMRILDTWRQIISDFEGRPFPKPAPQKAAEGNSQEDNTPKEDKKTN